MLVNTDFACDSKFAGLLDAKIDSLLETQFAAGRLYAAITSRPGQSGRADGYILEGKELEVSCLFLSIDLSRLILAPSST